MIIWIFIASLFFNIAHFVYPAVWSFFAIEVLQWSAFEIGLSLSAVGIGFAVVQGWLIRLIIPRFGEAKTIILGLIAGAISLTILSFTTLGWVIYLFIPLSALSAMVTPAMSGLISKQVPENAQGELQGVIASIVGITIIIGPLMMTQIFGYFTNQNAPVYFPGAPFLAAAALMVMALVPLLIGLKRIQA